jgi:hypothetical protein
MFSDERDPNAGISSSCVDALQRVAAGNSNKIIAGKHGPLRKVFAEAKDVLTAVCPCCKANPPFRQLVGATGIFDYVIRNEAAPVFPRTQSLPFCTASI